jgi:beta-lactamase regulating signal transducer with metallopeptidase domain
MKAVDMLLEITIYSFVLFAAIMLLKRCFGSRMSPLLHYAVWALLVLRLLMPFTLDSSVHLFVLPGEKQADAVEEQAPPQPPALSAETGAYAPAALAAQTAPQRGQITPVMPTASPANRPAALTAQQLILPVWLAGAAIGMLYLLILHSALRLKIRRNAAPPSERLLALFDEVRGELGIRTDIKLVCQYEYGTPALMFPKTVLMPIGTLVAMDDEQVRFALRHELTHFRRGDHIVSLLLSALNAVYWFNPVVWIAFGQIRADMEAACDSAVVRRFDGAQRSRYASLIVSLFARPERRRLALGMAQGASRKAVEQRIRGIFTEGGSRREAKVVSAALAAALLFACFTTACQPTPTKPVVVNKGDGGLEQKLTQTATPLPQSGAATNAAQSLRQRFSIPERLQAELANEGDTVRVHIDAAIDVPDVGAAAVYSAEYSPFTQEQLEKMHQALLGGAQIYEPIPLSREDIAQQIVLTQAEIADAKKRGDDVWKAKMERELKGLQEQYANTPENIMPTPAELKLRPKDDGDGRGQYDELYVMAEVDGRRFSFFVTNSAAYNYAELIEEKAGSMIGYNSQPLETPQGLAVSLEDARRQAETIAARLDGDMELAAATVGVEPVPDGRQVWMFAFTRSVGGFPTPYDSRDVNDNLASDAPYQPYERLWIMIDDKGVAGMRWTSQMKLTGTVNAVLLPYAEIEAKARQMLLANSQGRFEISKKVSKFLDVKVDRVTLGLMRINVPDKPGQYLLVPVWDFFGKNIPDTSGYPDVKKQNAPDYENMPSQSLLTINAIDGSVIDRSKGY